jgi:hypothetical protein
MLILNSKVSLFAPIIMFARHYTISRYYRIFITFYVDFFIIKLSDAGIQILVSIASSMYTSKSIEHKGYLSHVLIALFDIIKPTNC